MRCVFPALFFFFRRDNLHPPSLYLFSRLTYCMYSTLHPKKTRFSRSVHSSIVACMTEKHVSNTLFFQAVKTQNFRDTSILMLLSKHASSPFFSLHAMIMKFHLSNPSSSSSLFFFLCALGRGPFETLITSPVAPFLLLSSSQRDS